MWGSFLPGLPRATPITADLNVRARCLQGWAQRRRDAAGCAPRSSLRSRPNTVSPLHVRMRWQHLLLEPSARARAARTLGSSPRGATAERARYCENVAAASTSRPSVDPDARQTLFPGFGIASTKAATRACAAAPRESTQWGTFRSRARLSRSETAVANVSLPHAPREHDLLVTFCSTLEVDCACSSRFRARRRLRLARSLQNSSRGRLNQTGRMPSSHDAVARVAFRPTSNSTSGRILARPLRRPTALGMSTSLAGPVVPRAPTSALAQCRRRVASTSVFQGRVSCFFG